MSKISKQKALETYPTPLDNEPFISEGFIDEKRREGYIVGYDQAMQDFIEKAMEYFKGKPIHRFWVEQFKNLII